MEGFIEIEMPNGVKVLAVAIKYVGDYYLICYAQNRLFTVCEPKDDNMYYGGVLVEYCVIPEYDDILKEYSISE